MGSVFGARSSAESPSLDVDTRSEREDLTRCGHEREASDRPLDAVAAAWRVGAGTTIAPDPAVDRHAIREAFAAAVRT